MDLFGSMARSVCFGDMFLCICWPFFFYCLIFWPSILSCLTDCQFAFFFLSLFSLWNFVLSLCLSATGLVAYADLDERAIDALREFNEEGALSVLQQFKESDLSHVQVSPSAVSGS